MVHCYRPHGTFTYFGANVNLRDMSERDPVNQSSLIFGPIKRVALAKSVCSLVKGNNPSSLLDTPINLSQLDMFERNRLVSLSGTINITQRVYARALIPDFLAV